MAAFQKSDIERYFIAEKSESIVFILLGALAIAVAISCFIYFRASFCTGLAIPLLLVAVVQITVGLTVYKRSDSNRIDMVYAFDMEPGKLKNEEIPRMEIVMKNFAIYRWMEIGLAIIGLVLILFFRTNPEYTIWYGIGVGLSIQGIVMLVADFFAEKRGFEYLQGLKSLFGE